MSDYPDALIEKVANAIYANEQETIESGWPEWDDCRDGSSRSVLDAAVAAVDALGLREELRGAYGFVSSRRYVTEWEPIRD